MEAGGNKPMFGPSPRGRGTHLHRVLERFVDRAIPARAGNASPLRNRTIAPAGHPRAGGERNRRHDLGDVGNGPSPRGRGTLAKPKGPFNGLRAIPARAGNANRPGDSARRRTGHPRAGGERASTASDSSGNHGPSPRGRGTRRGPGRKSPGPRAIPARAGNATACHIGSHHPAGHPRAGGERDFIPNRFNTPFGPSPRGRGTRSARNST